MDFVTIEYRRDLSDWCPKEIDEMTQGQEVDFDQACKLSKLTWEHLDVMQRYCFKVVYEDRDESVGYPEVKGLRFLGVEARWGEYVAATQDQLVLRNPV